MALNALLPHHCSKTNVYRLCVEQEKTVAVVQRQQGSDEMWKMLLLA